MRPPAARPLCRPVSLLLAAASCALTLPAPAGAEGGAWVSLGPDGGWVEALAVHPVEPRVVYAGTSRSGIFKSVNRGRRWAHLAASPGDGDAFRVEEILIEPLAPEHLYARDPHSAWASEDGGLTWRPLARPLAPQPSSILDLALDPTLPGHLLAGTLDGPYESFDGGRSWERLGRDFPDDPTTAGSRLAVTSLVLDPRDPRRVYALTQQGVLRSADGGDTWSFANQGLELSFELLDLYVAPGSPSRLVLWTLNEGLFESRDGAASWRPLAPGLRGLVTRLVADPSSPDLLFAVVYRGGLYRSRDGGRRWQRVDAGILGDPSAVALDPSTPGVVYAGSDAGAWASADGGASWQPRQRGLEAQRIRALTLAGSAEGHLLAGTDDGVILSSFDRGGSWRRTFPAPGEPIPGGAVRDLAASPADPSRVWGAAATTFVRSRDGGASWQEVILGGPPQSVLGIFPHPGDPETFYVAAVVHSILTTTPYLVRKTVDGGASWTDVTPFRGFQAIAMAIDPSDPETLYLAGLEALARSDDGGASWLQLIARLGQPPPRLTGLAIDPARPERVWAAADDGRLWRSDDRGESWQAQAAAGLPAGEVTALLVAGEPASLHASVFGAGVFRSTDRGATFEEVGSGLPPGGVDLAAGSAPAALYAGTERGAYHLLLTGCTAGPTTLCLGDGRFRLEVEHRGVAAGVRPLTSRAGAFWFARPDNLEVTVRMLDGRAVNGHWWLFFGALSSQPYVLTVTDTATGRTFRYDNPRGTLASRGVTDAFPDRVGPGSTAAHAAPADVPAGLTAGEELETEAVVASRATLEPLTLLDRFDLSVRWDTGRGRTGAGHGVTTGGKAGYFWYFDARNPELTLKILDGRAVNGRFWLFYSALSNVGFELTVTDRQSGTSRTYRHPPGRFVARADTAAF